MNNSSFVPVRVGQVRTRFLSSVGLLGLVMLTVVAWWWQRPPAPVAGGDDRVFSSERAAAHLTVIATEASPTGSAANEGVGEYLAGELQELGLDVAWQEGLGAWTFERTGGRTIEAGVVRNIVATLPGTDPTGRVILAAHYDTVPLSPGAGDDKGPVAAILEATRVLAGEPTMRNDLVVLLSDGEEPGMLGASLFAEREAAAGGVVLNWEGYGRWGPSLMFQSSAANAELVGELGRSVPGAVADSGLAELFQLASNNTDLTVLREAGFAGLDFSWVDGIAHYHSPTDTIENLSMGSLQHHGEVMLGMARALGQRDLSSLDDGGAAVYFTLFGQVVVYPASWVWPLVAVSALALVAVTAAARRRKLTTWSRVVLAFLAGSLPLIAIPLAAVGLWEVMKLIRPEYVLMAPGGIGDVYHPVPFRLAIVALTVAVVAVWYLAFRRRLGPVALMLGASAWLLTVGAASAAFAPGLSHLGIVPVWGTLAGTVVTMQLREEWWGRGLAALVVAPGVILLFLTGEASLAALGLAGAYGGALFLALAAMAAMPAVAVGSGDAHLSREEQPRIGSAAWVPGLAVMAAVGLGAWGLVSDRFTAEYPVPTHLSYLVDADAGDARWASSDPWLHPWTADFVSDRPDTAEEFPLRSRPEWVGAAEIVDLSAPVVEVLESENGRLHLRARSPRGGELMVIRMDAVVGEVEVMAAGEAIQVAAPADTTPSPGSFFELRFHAPPPEGFEVALETGTPAAELTVTDVTFGLDGLPAFAGRPAGLRPASALTPLPTDAVVVTATSGALEDDTATP